MENSILNSFPVDPGIFLIVLLILNMILIIVTIRCTFYYKRLYRGYDVFMRGKDAETLEDTIMNLVEYTEEIGAQNESIFLGVGLVFMLYTVMMLVSNIENTFNEIWQVKKKRSVFRTITDYMAMFFLFPMLIVISSGLSLFLATMADSMTDFQLLGPAVKWLLDISR